MERWAKGYSRAELDRAQDRYGLRFPPDLIDLLLDRRPADGFDWRTDEKSIRDMLDWPFERLRFDVDHGAWWPGWGERPRVRAERVAVLKWALGKAPKLIPLYSHRFLPETPGKAGNPVFSMHGFDTIYYGANLEEYFACEFEGLRELGGVRHIPFWSDIVERYEDVLRGQE